MMGNWGRLFTALGLAVVLQACDSRTPGGSMTPGPQPTATPAPTTEPTPESAPTRCVLYVQTGTSDITTYDLDIPSGELGVSAVRTSQGPPGAVARGRIFGEWSRSLLFEIHALAGGSAMVAAYRIADDDTLADAPGSAASPSGFPSAVATDRYVFSIQSAGGSQLIRSVPVNGATGGGDFASRPAASPIDTIALSRGGAILYAAEQVPATGSRFVVYGLGPTGTGSVFTSEELTGIGQHIAAGRKRVFALTYGFSGAVPDRAHIHVFDGDETGALAARGSITVAPERARRLVADPQGRFLFVRTDEGIDSYVLDATTALPALTHRIGIDDMDEIAVEPSGGHLYVTRTDGTLWGYFIGPDTGRVQDIGKLGAGTGAMVMVSRPLD